MKKRSRQKFLVVSYDDDQQQWFWDYIAAKTEGVAIAYVCKRRPYIIAKDAASLLQVQTIANDLATRSLTRITHQFNWDTRSTS
jgi:hypothetical protein